MHKKQKTIVPVLALILAYVTWGVNLPMLKLGLESFPVPIFMSIRFLIASLILLPFAIRTWKPLKRRDFYLMIISSVISISLGSVALNIGLTKTSSIDAAIIGLLGPLVLYILSVEFLKERLSFKTLFGILIAFGGSIIIIGKPWDGGGMTVLIGNLFVVISMLCGVIDTLIFKPLMNKTSAYQATFMNLFFGILPVTVVAITQFGYWNVHDITSRSMVGLVVSTAGILVANFLFFFALRYKKVQVVGIYQYIKPVITIIVAWFVLAERPSLKFAVGAGLVFLGIYLSEVHLSSKTLFNHYKKYT